MRGGSSSSQTRPISSLCSPVLRASMQYIHRVGPTNLGHVPLFPLAKTTPKPLRHTICTATRQVMTQLATQHAAEVWSRAVELMTRARHS